MNAQFPLGRLLAGVLVLATCLFTAAARGDDGVPAGAAPSAPVANAPGDAQNSTPGAGGGLNIKTQADDAVVLVANPELADPVYTHTVLLATPMEGGGYIGVIVNRPTTQSLASLFPEHAPSREVRDPVYFGGPVLTQIIFALVHSDQSPGEGTLKMSNGLFLAIKETTIDHVIENTPNDAHYFVGTVMWQPGELQSEIKRGVWSVIDPDTSVVFDRNPEKLWEHLQEKVNALSVKLEGPRAVGRERVASLSGR